MTLAHSAMLTSAFLIATLGPAAAGRLDVPVIEQAGDGHMATCYSATVAGLKPGGDGFLAVRTGPGAQYRKIAEIHNGHVVYVFDSKGKWRGVAFGRSNGTCSATRTHRVRGKVGWVHSNWLRDLAG